MKFTAFLGLTIILFTSCKKEIATSKNDSVDLYEVSVSLKIKKDDVLILFYKDGSNSWFDQDHTIWQGVKGNEQIQTVTFKLPQGVLMTDMRLDIGRDEFNAQEPIEIKKVAFQYLDNRFEISEDQFANSFEPNEYITYDTQTKQYAFKQDTQGKYDPYFVAKSTVYNDIRKVAGL